MRPTLHGFHKVNLLIVTRRPATKICPERTGDRARARRGGRGRSRARTGGFAVGGRRRKGRRATGSDGKEEGEAEGGGGWPKRVSISAVAAAMLSRLWSAEWPRPTAPRADPSLPRVPSPPFPLCLAVASWGAFKKKIELYACVVRRVATLGTRVIFVGNALQPPSGARTSGRNERRQGQGCRHCTCCVACHEARLGRVFSPSFSDLGPMATVISDARRKGWAPGNVRKQHTARWTPLDLSIAGLGRVDQSSSASVGLTQAS